MDYTKISIHTKKNAEDIISSILYELGIKGCLIESDCILEMSKYKKEYEALDLQSANNDNSIITFYVQIDNNKYDIENVRRRKELDALQNDKSIDSSYFQNTDYIYTEEELNDLLAKFDYIVKNNDFGIDLLNLKITREDVVGDDYLTKWRENFKTISIENIDIEPYWEKDKYLKKENRIPVFINPGEAFGTGEHESTKLCIKNLVKYIKKGDNVLDIGTGSGILVIIAKKFGAEKVIGLDVDEVIKENFEENIKLNDLTLKEDNIKLIIGNLINDKQMQKEFIKETFDIIIANILTPVLVLLLEIIYIFMKDNSYLILSGISTNSRNEIYDKVKQAGKYSIIEETSENGWISMVIEKKKAPKIGKNTKK